ncbi:MAG: hypothetical protein DRI36_01195 [Caldiserica bacterium]|nr:MAG: hypothetical protein DRI36_01195 [Caldisericota bacterium]
MRGIRILLLVISIMMNFKSGYGIENSKDPGKIYKQGVKEFKSGNYRKAIDYFMQVLLIQPKNVKARKYLKKCALEILKPKIEAMNLERQKMVLKAREYLFLKQKKFNLEELYKRAVKAYKKKQYLRAGEYFRKILEVSSDYKNTEEYFNQLEKKMYEISKDITSDPVSLSYAKGYISWWAGKIQEAKNEWEKYLALNGSNEEVEEYLKRAKKELELRAKEEYQREVEAKIRRIYKEGNSLFEKKKYIGAIKKFERVIVICDKEIIPSSDIWKEKSRKMIEKSLEELKKIAASVKKKKRKKVKKVEKKEIIDPEAAQRHYTQGLVAYAQGRLREAIREWDLALRLNPKHEKARLALQKAKKELGLEE